MNARTEIPLGVIDDMAAEEYHSIMALSAGGLKRLRQSPLHFWSAQIDPDREHGEPTPAMKAGTLAHCAILEPAALAERYMIRPAGIDGRTKEGKAWLASLPAGIDVCTEDEMATALRQAAAIRALPEVGALLETGRPEVSAFWHDTLTGELSKCRPDWVSPAGNGVILLDVKTAIDVSPAGFAKAVSNWSYHLQAAHYSDGYPMASGKPVLGFVFACVESTRPHAAAAYMLDDDALDRAREVNLRLRHLYAECRRTNTWPGYAETIQPLSLPPWAFN
jgi:exodeoxyribonuclease VIII